MKSHSKRNLVNFQRNHLKKSRKLTKFRKIDFRWKKRWNR